MKFSQHLISTWPLHTTHINTLLLLLLCIFFVSFCYEWISVDVKVNMSMRHKCLYWSGNGNQTTTLNVGSRYTHTHTHKYANTFQANMHSYTSIRTSTQKHFNMYESAQMIKRKLHTQIHTYTHTYISASICTHSHYGNPIWHLENCLTSMIIRWLVQWTSFGFSNRWNPFGCICFNVEPLKVVIKFL